MKYLKMLGLAVVAAAALSALLGAGSASATELCKANESPCSEANMYGAKTAITGTLKASTKAVLTGSFVVECGKSSMSGKTANTGGSAETVKSEGILETMTFTECGLCSVTVKARPSLEVHTHQSLNANGELVTAAANGNGTITAKEFSVSINCLGVTCEYGGSIEGTEITVTGGNPAVIKATKAKIPVTGGAGESTCGKEGQWDAEYTVSPSPMFVE